MKRDDDSVRLPRPVSLLGMVPITQWRLLKIRGPFWIYMAAYKVYTHVSIYIYIYAVLFNFWDSTSFLHSRTAKVLYSPTIFGLPTPSSWDITAGFQDLRISFNGIL